MSHRETAIVSIFFTVLLGAVVYCWSWIADPTHGGAVNAASLAMGAVGFPITLLQLWRTKKAALAAQEAANEAKVRFASFNALRECDRVKTECIALSETIKEEAWGDAVTRYNALADHIIDIQHSNLEVGDDFTGELGRAVTEIESNSLLIEKEIKADKGRLEKTKQLQELRKIYISINKAVSLLERQSA
jgi:hypothetical protein